MDRLDGAVVIECRAGALARARGVTPESGSTHLDMARWKGLIDAAATRPDVPVAAVFFGEANLIAGYRLYYMLRYASRARVRDLTLVTDGAFWIDEASTWLAECGVSRIALVGDTLDFESRIGALNAAASRAGVPAPRVVTLAPGAIAGAQEVHAVHR